MDNMDNIFTKRIQTQIQTDMVEYLNTFLFEPLDKVTKENVTTGVTAYLHHLLNVNAIEDYSAAVQLQWHDGGSWKEGLSLDVFIRPINQSEFIRQTFVLTDTTGTKASDPIQAYDYAMRIIKGIK